MGFYRWISNLKLVILGLIVGFLNITERKPTPFLVAAVALLVTGTAEVSLAVIPQIAIAQSREYNDKNLLL